MAQKISKKQIETMTFDSIKRMFYDGNGNIYFDKVEQIAKDKELRQILIKSLNMKVNNRLQSLAEYYSKQQSDSKYNPLELVQSKVFNPPDKNEFGYSPMKTPSDDADYTTFRNEINKRLKFLESDWSTVSGIKSMQKRAVSTLNEKFKASLGFSWGRNLTEEQAKEIGPVLKDLFESHKIGSTAGVKVYQDGLGELLTTTKKSTIMREKGSFEDDNGTFKTGYRSSITGEIYRTPFEAWKNSLDYFVEREKINMEVYNNFGKQKDTKTPKLSEAVKNRRR